MSTMLASDDNNPNFLGARNPDSALHVQFYKKPVKQTYRTQEGGFPVYETVVFVRIHTPGNQLNIIDTPAREDHKRRFPMHWAHFQNQQGGEGKEVGLPVAQWPLIDVSLAETLKALKFYTVESIAFASDEQIGKLGMAAGMAPFTFRDKAKAYLAVAKDSHALAKKDEEMNALKKQLEELTALVKGQAPLQPRPDVQPVPVEPTGNDERSELANQYEAKFGKKPHHKMTVKTLKEKLVA